MPPKMEELAAPSGHPSRETLKTQVETVRTYFVRLLEIEVYSTQSNEEARKREYEKQ